MKKSLLGMALGLAISANASAAITDTPVASYDLSASTASFIVSSGANSAYFEFGTAGLGALTNLELISASNTTLTYALYLDLDSVLNNSVTIDSSSLVTTGFLAGFGNPSTTLNLLPNAVYTLEIFPNGSGTAQVIAAVPVPAAALLFGSALVGGGALRRKQKAQLAA